MYTERKNKGLTLVELMISLSLIAMIGAFTTAFLKDFTRDASIRIIKNEMTEQLRNTQYKLEKELTSALKIEESVTINGTTYNSGDNTIVLKVPVYNSMGMLVYDENGEPVGDTVVFYAVNDGAGLRLRGVDPATNQPIFNNYRLKFAIDADNNSDRSYVDFITDQVVLQNLAFIDSSNNNYFTLNKRITTDIKPYYDFIAESTDSPLFQYFDADGENIDSFTQAEFDRITTVRVNLFSEKEYGSLVLTRNKVLEIRLRGAGELVANN